MRLTAHTDYALRVLIFLGVHPERRATIHEIAIAYGISENHLMKVVYRLGGLGYIETIRGKHGGMRLARPPRQVRVGKLVRDMEEGFDLVECFREHQSCPISEVCRLQGVVSQAIAAFLAVLDRYTLSDLVWDADGLGAALGLPAAIPPAAAPKRTARKARAG